MQASRSNGSKEGPSIVASWASLAALPGASGRAGSLTVTKRVSSGARSACRFQGWCVDRPQADRWAQKGFFQGCSGLLRAPKPCRSRAIARDETDHANLRHLAPSLYCRESMSSRRALPGCYVLIERALPSQHRTCNRPWFPRPAAPMTHRVCASRVDLPAGEAKGCHSRRPTKAFALPFQQLKAAAIQVSNAPVSPVDSRCIRSLDTLGQSRSVCHYQLQLVLVTLLHPAVRAAFWLLDGWVRAWLQSTAHPRLSALPSLAPSSAEISTYVRTHHLASSRAASMRRLRSAAAARPAAAEHYSHDGSGTATPPVPALSLQEVGAGHIP